MNIVDAIKMMPSYIGSNGRTGGEIDKAEQALGTTFAPDYRLYLKEIGLTSFNGRELTGLTDTARLDVVAVTRECREQPYNMEESWYVIEEAGIDGIIICQSPDGTVYAMAPGSKTMEIANNLSEYIAG